MAELLAKQGKDIILLYRLLSKATEEAAWKLAFQTEHSNEKTRDYNMTPTKDGPIGALADVEYSLSATSIAANGDPHLDEMDEAFDNAAILEVWEIDKAEKGTDGAHKDKYKAKYLRAYLTSFSYEPNSEDALELSLEFGVFGRPQKGYATLTNEQADVVQYVFKDTVKEVAAPTPPQNVSGAKKSNGDIEISYDAPLGAVAYLTHYGDANTTDPHDAKYMGYSETLKFTLKASDIPVGAKAGDKIPFYVQAYNVVAPSGTTNIEKAAALHDAENITGSAWSAVVEVTI